MPRNPGYLIRAVLVALALVPAASAAAHPTDANTFAHQVAVSYHVDPHHVLAADIDRDGDLDVLAATNDGFIVWVNDGAGRFTTQTPEPRPLVDGHPAGSSWNGAESLDRETIQSESIPIVASCAHAPPDDASRSNAAFDALVRGSSALGYRPPRAPPFV